MYYAGKKFFERKIHEECDALMEAVARFHGAPFNPHHTIMFAVTNVINIFVFGERSDYNDEEFRKIVHKLHRFFSLPFLAAKPSNFIPILRWLPHGKETKESLQCIEVFFAYMRRRIEEHRSTFDDTELRDMIDLYLKNEKDAYENAPCYSENEILQVIMDVFIAGANVR